MEESKEGQKTKSRRAKIRWIPNVINMQESILWEPTFLITGFEGNVYLYYESHIKHSDDYLHWFKTYTLMDSGYVECVFQIKEAIFILSDE